MSEIASFLADFERTIVRKVLDDYGYTDLGDVQYWRSQDPDDPEPQKLLEWYQAFDDAIWKEIDKVVKNGVPTGYDPLQIGLQIFEATKDKLPPNKE